MERMEATETSVRRLLVETMEAITGLSPGRVIVEGRADRRPSEGLYCTLWFRSARPEAHNDAEFDPETSDEYLCNETLVDVQVSFWGSGAKDAAMEAVSQLGRSEREKDLGRVTGIPSVGEIQDIPAKFEGQMRERALFNLQFYVCYGRRYPAEWFDTTNISVIWTRPGGEEITIGA